VDRPDDVRREGLCRVTPPGPIAPRATTGQAPSTHALRSERGCKERGSPTRPPAAGLLEVVVLELPAPRRMAELPERLGLAAPRIEEIEPFSLDHVLIYGRRHLERVLQAYVAHYVEERPHRGLRLAVPAGNRTPPVRRTTRTPVERRDVLGGLVHEYRWAA
jgi:hypothetical protein